MSSKISCWRLVVLFTKYAKMFFILNNKVVLEDMLCSILAYYTYVLLSVNDNLGGSLDNMLMRKRYRK